jgi:DNA (cytosine-5)-methyltransferase 1
VASPTVLSLFSGVGGLELAIRLVWPEARVLGYCERDAYAAGILLARMEDAALEPAPVWCGNIQDLDASSLRDRVDVVCGGFPCQDISAAGRGEGIQEGNRSGLFFELMRVVRGVRPRFVFLENVSAITVRGLDTVLGELAESGFDAEWICVRASDVGAPHRRERWFCLAVANTEGLNRREHQPQWGSEERVAAGGAGETMADALRPTGQQDTGSAHGDEAQDAGWRTDNDHRLSGVRGELGAALADAAIQREREQDNEASTIAREDARARVGWRGDCFPPGPNDRKAWGESSSSTRASRRRLNPAFVCWLMGWPFLWTHPEPISFGAVEMESYLSKQRRLLQNYFGE